MFFDKWRKYSYAAQKHQQFRRLRVLLWLAILFVIYNALTVFGFSVWKLDNNTMQPGLRQGDRLIFSSLVIPDFLSDIQGGDNLPFKRGSIVLVDVSTEKENLMVRIFDGVVRFFTLQQVGLYPREHRLYIKRVIGLPGDEVNMINFVFRVKPAGSEYSLTEFEYAEHPYQPAIPNVPALWDESIPFSGTMDTIVLGPGECFVICDDRSNTNDSRTWGPVSPDNIKARAVFRFWPFNRMGRP